MCSDFVRCIIHHHDSTFGGKVSSHGATHAFESSRDANSRDEQFFGFDIHRSRAVVRIYDLMNASNSSLT